MHKDFKRLLLIDGFWWFIYGLAAPFLTIYFKNFGGLEQVGFSVAILSLIKGFISLISTKFLKKEASIKKIFLIGQVIEGLRIISFIFANNIFQIYLIQVLGGITGGFVIPAYNVIYVRVGEDEDDNAFRTKTGVNNIIVGLSALLAGMLISVFGYVPIFIMWGVMEVFYGFYIYYNV